MTVLETINGLRKTKSRNRKLEIMTAAESPIFQEVLSAAYDPFVMYGIKQIPWKGEGDKTIEHHWYEVGEVLATLASAHGGTAEKELLKNFITQLTPADAELMKCIIKKDLRAGISAATINTAFADLIPVFGAMKAKQFTEARWKNDLFASVKLDGLRCQYHSGAMLSMNGQKLHGLDHIVRQLMGYKDFDGELIVPGKHFQTISGLLRNHSAVPDAVFCVFDVVSDAESKLPFAERYAMLEKWAHNLNWSNRVSDPTTITLVKHVQPRSLSKTQRMFQQVLDAGYEGLMLKTADHVYQASKRSWDWMKLKNVCDEDLPIVDFFEGTGKYEGMLGGVVVKRANDVEVRVGSGFSDHEREVIWRHPEKHIGKIIEVHYHEETPDGSLRHPRFKRFRPDK